MLKDVLCRRLKRKDPLPDLLLVDGGKGQLKMAQEVLKELGLENVPLAALAKARPQDPNPDHKQDRIFLPGRSNPVFFKPGSGALFLLQRIRDEAHRFAITHHRKLRGKSFLRSRLEEIPGIGPKRRKRLLEVFGSLENIQAASKEELIQKGRLSEALAQALKK
jgi:excinuclease ABC subunit C